MREIFPFEAPIEFCNPQTSDRGFAHTFNNQATVVWNFNAVTMLKRTIIARVFMSCRIKGLLESLPLGPGASALSLVSFMHACVLLTNQPFCSVCVATSVGTGGVTPAVCGSGVSTRAVGLRAHGPFGRRRVLTVNRDGEFGRQIEPLSGNSREKLNCSSFSSNRSVMLHKAGNARGHKPVTVVLACLFVASPT